MKIKSNLTFYTRPDNTRVMRPRFIDFVPIAQNDTYSAGGFSSMCPRENKKPYRVEFRRFCAVIFFLLTTLATTKDEGKRAERRVRGMMRRRETAYGGYENTNDTDGGCYCACAKLF